jgi:hypothetical protein
VIPILDPSAMWYCPNCPNEARLPFPKPGQVHLHICMGLRGLTAPMIPVGTRAKVEAREREDYVAGEVVQLDPEFQRPVMSVVTTRDDGQDAIIFAPMATAQAKVEER